MATTAPALLTTSPADSPLSLEEYLRTSYHPDCDFVDGHLEERNMGDAMHGLLQMQLGFWFISHQKEWNIRVMSELRTQVGSNRVRLPDVAVVQNDAAVREPLRTTPPLIAIEILSPDDRVNRVVQRLDDFVAMGVAHIWLLDPIDRTAFTYTNAGLKLADSARLTVPNSPIYLDLPEIFSALD
jgi:Uma2 family endonuclease